MTDSGLNNTAKLIEQLYRFTAFVQQADGHQGCISFRDSAGFLGREEDYKSRIAEEARKEMRFENWSESWIGTGKIADCARKAMNKSGNLVNKNQRVDFKNRLDPDNAKYRAEAEKVLYDIYRNPICEEAKAFEEAVAVFGAKYDTISFLFFIKDDSRFLPVSASHFDKGFEELDVDYRTSFQCSWENYRGFLDIINDIRTVMEEVLPMQGLPRLIDAHSFVWVIQEERFIKWEPDTLQEAQIEGKAEEALQEIVSGTGGKKKSTSNVYNRSIAVINETRKRANGICQYCRQKAPFADKKDVPYLETHHIIWLSRGGMDSTANTVALCPNCHRRMHVLDAPDDIEMLKKAIGK